jgi:hypothetical protein
MPSVHLRSNWALEDSLLFLEVLTEGLKVFLDFGLKGLPLRFQPRLGGFPGGLARLRLLSEGTLEFVAPIAQVGNELIGLRRDSARISAALLSSVTGAVHLIDPLFGPIKGRCCFV